MNSNYDPKKAWIVLIALLALLLCACLATATAEEKTSDTRFVAEHVTSIGSLGKLYIITDTETGVQYLYVSDGSRAGLTVLEEAPGEEVKR